MSVKTVFAICILVLYSIGLLFTYSVMKVNLNGKDSISWGREILIATMIWVFSPFIMVTTFISIMSRRKAR